MIATSTVITILGIIGSIASIVGIPLTFLQAKSAAKIARETKDEVAKSLSVVSLAKCSAMNHEIRQYLRADKHELANLRMRELRDALIELHQMPGFQSDQLRATLHSHQQTIGSDVLSIERHIENPDIYLFNNMAVITNLEKLSAFLVEQEAKIKFSN